MGSGLAISNATSAAQFAYIDIDCVGAGIVLPSICEGLRNQIYLGNDRFAEKISRGVTGRGDLREVPRAQRRFLAKTLVNFEKAFYYRREAMAQSYLSELQPISAYITLRSVVLFGEGVAAET